MTLSLKPHQREGAAWLTSRRFGILADDMGLGKTATALAAINKLGLSRVLIICPAVARRNWEREWRMWRPTAGPAQIIEDLSTLVRPRGAVITGYNQLAEDIETHGRVTKFAGPWQAVIADEAHMLKGYDALRTRAVLGQHGVVRTTDRLWALTGTPVTNHPGDLWIWMHVFGATTMTEEEWVLHYCHVKIDRRHHRRSVLGARKDRLDELKALMRRSGLFLRRHKEDELSLPPITWEHVQVPYAEPDIAISREFAGWAITPESTQRLRTKVELQEELLRRALGETRRADPTHAEVAELRALEGMATTVAELRRWTGLAKVETLADRVQQELARKLYERIIIFAWHSDVLEGLMLRIRDLHGIPTVMVRGDTTPRNRQIAVDSFQAGRIPVFLGQIAAAGTAITLTAATEVLFAEQSWVPGENAQAAQRAYRIGQHKPVRVRVASLADSVDEAVNQVLMRKSRVIASLMDGRDLRSSHETTRMHAVDTGEDLY